MLKKLITIIANMYLSRGPKSPPCEEKVIQLMLAAQKFKFKDENVDEESEVRFGRFSYKIGVEAVEIRQDAKLVLASVTNMRNVSFYKMPLAHQRSLLQKSNQTMHMLFIR